MILYFYCYCGIGVLALIAAHYLQTQEQAEKAEDEMLKSKEEAGRTLPIPALAAVYVLTAATTVLVWPYFVARSFLEVGE